MSQQWKKPIIAAAQEKASELKKRACLVALVEVDGRKALCLLRHNTLTDKPIKGLLEDLNVDDMESILKGMGVPAYRTHLIKHKKYGHNIGVYVFLDETDVVPKAALQNVKPSQRNVDHSYEQTTRQQERQRFKRMLAKSAMQAVKSVKEPQRGFKQAYIKSVAQAARYKQQL